MLWFRQKKVALAVKDFSLDKQKNCGTVISHKNKTKQNKNNKKPNSILKYLTKHNIVMGFG